MVPVSHSASSTPLIGIVHIRVSRLLDSQSLAATDNDHSRTPMSRWPFAVQAAAQIAKIDFPQGDMEQECLQGLSSGIVKDLPSGRGGLEVALALAHQPGCFDKMANKVQRERVWFVDHFVKPECFGLSNPGQVKRSHISATTLRERLPVVVNFSPGPTDAEWSKIKAFRATADCPISSGEKSAANRMAPTGGNGGRRRASKLLWSSIVHAGTIPPSQFVTADFCRKPDATMVPSSRLPSRIEWHRKPLIEL